MRSLHADGPLIRFRRESLGHTRAQFAERVGISYPYLSRIEQGIRNPSPPTMAAIAAALGCTIMDISRPIELSAAS